jgi:hypothetical protein
MNKRVRFSKGLQKKFIKYVKIFIYTVANVASLELRFYSDTSTMIYNQAASVVEG